MYANSSIINFCISMAGSFLPNLFSVYQLPEPSAEGRTIKAMRLSAGASPTKRKVLILGGTHARELMNPDAIMYLAIELAESYLDSTPITYGGRTWSVTDIRLILESLDIWFVPCVNPDGREYVMNVDSLWRKNRRLAPSPTAPACVGVDLNRNADIVWGVLRGNTTCSPCQETYVGPSAFSEPESRNIKHLLETQRFVTFLDVHSYSELVMFPWGHATSQTAFPNQNFTGLQTGTCQFSIPAAHAEYMPQQDVNRFRNTGIRIANDIKAVRGRQYRSGSIFDILYGATGNFSDYAWSRHISDASNQKTYAFSFETGPVVPMRNNPSQVDLNESFHPANPEPIWEEIKAGILSLLEQSICAIDAATADIRPGSVLARQLRTIRDEEMSGTGAGRQWRELYERAQFALLSVALRQPHLMKEAVYLVSEGEKWLAGDGKEIPRELANRAAKLISQLGAGTKNASLKRDAAAAARLAKRAGGLSVSEFVKVVLREPPFKGRGRRPIRRGAK